MPQCRSFIPVKYAMTSAVLFVFSRSMKAQTRLFLWAYHIFYDILSNWLIYSRSYNNSSWEQVGFPLVFTASWYCSAECAVYWVHKIDVANQYICLNLCDQTHPSPCPSSSPVVRCPQKRSSSSCRNSFFFFYLLLCIGQLLSRLASC